MDKTQYETIIGLEVHVELNTKTKMFCKCSADYFGAEPNTHTCPVCLGLPGALPFINKQAIEDCIKIGLALNCEVAEQPLFERKNYFYPDSAKGFQTSQYRWPQTVNGWLDVEDDKGNQTRIRVNRAHQEEDTGKLTHVGGGAWGVEEGDDSTSHEPRATTLVDFNRSSVPLVEIVTEPDFRDSSQIRDYAKKLQQIFRYLGVSNADMERGDMRLEANVSVRRVQGTGYRVQEENEIASHPLAMTVEEYIDPKDLPPYRVELKNINSFRFMVAAVEYEIRRQIELYEAGREDELRQETRGWNEAKRETYLQRSKENANDYRYFPEPDLPVMQITTDDVKRITAEIPELPAQKMERFMKEYGISDQNAKILVEVREYAEHAERVIKASEFEAKDVANFLVQQKNTILKMAKFDDAWINDQLAQSKHGRIDDHSVIEQYVKEAIEENPDMVASYKAGKVAVLQALIGQVMRKSQGKADVGKTKEILEKMLS